jgi:hypothetical protein
MRERVEFGLQPPPKTHAGRLIVMAVSGNSTVVRGSGTVVRFPGSGCHFGRARGLDQVYWTWSAALPIATEYDNYHEAAEGGHAASRPELADPTRTIGTHYA